MRESMLCSAQRIRPKGAAAVRGGGLCVDEVGRPMVWCCFFVRTQVSSLQEDQG